MATTKPEMTAAQLFKHLVPGNMTTIQTVVREIDDIEANDKANGILEELIGQYEDLTATHSGVLNRIDQLSDAIEDINFIFDGERTTETD